MHGWSHPDETNDAPSRHRHCIEPTANLHRTAATNEFSLRPAGMELIPDDSEQPYETTRGGESKLLGPVAVAAGATPGLIIALFGWLGWIQFTFIADNDFTVFGGLVFAAIGGFMAFSKFSGRVREDL